MKIENVNAIVTRACIALRKNKKFKIIFENSKKTRVDYSTLNRQVFKVTFRYPNGNLYTLSFREENFTNPHTVPWTGIIKEETWKLPKIEDQIILAIAWCIYQEGIHPEGIVSKYPDGKEDEDE